MQIPFSPPDIHEEDIEAVVKVLRSGWITSGPVGEEFRHALTEFTQATDTILVNSATAALETALRLLNIGPGDEVIVPAYTYSASASVVHHVGATIKFVDVAPNSYFVAPETWAEAITERTKAIIPVDIAGVIAPTTPIFEAIKANQTKFQPTPGTRQEQLGRIAVIVDAAHSLGATRGKFNSGQFGDFTAFSFHAVKNLTTAEGGALTWNTTTLDNCLESDEIYRDARLLILHGQTKSALEKTSSSSWEYDIMEPAYKMNMADIMAALGLSQLRRYRNMIDRRHEIITAYDNGLADLPVSSLPHESTESDSAILAPFRSSGHLYLLELLHLEGDGEQRIAQRNTFIEEMGKAGVACNVHYKPLPMLTAYRNLGFDITDFPNAYAQYVKEVTLPLHTKLTDEQVAYVIATARQLLH